MDNNTDFMSRLGYNLRRPLRAIDRALVPPPPPRPPLPQVLADSLMKARYEHEEHVQAAEFHQAMIGMYEARIARLVAESAGAA